MTDEQTREALAAYAHEAWAGWMEYLFRFGAVDKYGAFTINADKVERWQRQMRTPYAELSEAEKASDRAEADKMLAIVGARLAALEAERDAIALKVTQEWGFVFATLAASVVESLETVTALELKEQRGHPYYWGQMSLLQTLRKMAESDAERFGSTPAALEAFSREPFSEEAPNESR